jgi:perosamine synthetase
MREIITELEKRNIQTRAIWGLINEQKPYKGEVTYKLEKSYYYADRVLNLPCSTNISENEIKYVANNVKQLLKELSNE